MKCYTGPQTSADSLEQPKQQKMDMEIWNEECHGLYRPGPL
jgi:hypothetical protein